MTDETPLESSPPDSDTPTGTSAIMWRRMTRSNSSAKPPAYSASGRDEENSGLTSGAQYFVTGPAVGGDRHEVAGQQSLHARGRRSPPRRRDAVQKEPVEDPQVSAAARAGPGTGPSARRRSRTVPAPRGNRGA